MSETDSWTSVVEEDDVTRLLSEITEMEEQGDFELHAENLQARRDGTQWGRQWRVSMGPCAPCGGSCGFLSSVTTPCVVDCEAVE